MTDFKSMFSEQKAISRLIRFLSVEGITGKEHNIGQEVVRALMEARVPRSNIRFDKANGKIPLPTQTGNLIVHLPGNRPGHKQMFMTHLDTVPLCAGAKPIKKGNRIKPAGKTALGGDNRTGVAVLVNLIATLQEKKLPHGPLTFLFTVREESGLWGARYVDVKDLGHPEMAFNFDGSAPEDVTIGAVGAERWHVAIHGKAAHAGAHPEKGISATAVAALALADIHQAGWFGKIAKNGRTGTSNVGSFGGLDGTSAGAATNVVTDYVEIHGEARSHKLPFVRQITQEYKKALRNAQSRVTNDKGRQARVCFAKRLDYYPFRLKKDAPVVQEAEIALKGIGLTPRLRITNGGLDANWMVRHGIPTVTFGAGQRNVHTLDEYVDIPDFLNGCRLAVALALQ